MPPLVPTPTAPPSSARDAARRPAPVACAESEAGELAGTDAVGMALALQEARAAMAADEVPIGCVIARLEDGELVVLGRGHNETRTRRDATAHAEMIALAAALRASGDARLEGATVYTTVEPCFMCAGALSHARVARVVWGVRDPKFGGCASLGQVLSDPRLNHRAAIAEGVRAAEARELLQQFFRNKRGRAIE